VRGVKQDRAIADTRHISEVSSQCTGEGAEGPFAFALGTMEAIDMPTTTVDIRGEDFYINGRKTYSEIEGSNPSAHGLLMNARFIQGIFDDKADPSRFARFGYGKWDPEENTDHLIAALPEWHAHGLRAFTVGFQGGGPFYTIKNHTIDNNPFGEDGKSLDPAYAARMDRLIRAADACGMVVIVSYLYAGQVVVRMRDGQAIIDAVKTASRFLKEGGYKNVLVEVANEHSIEPFAKHPLIYSPEGMVCLIGIAREESGGLPVGCSGGGGYVNGEVCRASDYILVHGNGCTRQQLYNLFLRAKEYSPGKPVVCNEDSQSIGQLEVAFRTHSSWGYYNNMSKQEPPANWRITKGEDQFFAYRMAQGIGIKVDPIPEADQYYLQGFGPESEYEGKRWIRLASLYPESINYVDYYVGDELVFTTYDEPFTLFQEHNWLQRGIAVEELAKGFRAEVHLRNGEVLIKRPA